LGKQIALLQHLEPRVLLTSYVVNTLSDTIAVDGQLSFREAITAAVSGAGSGDALVGSASNTIFFDPSLTASPATLDLTTLLPDLSGTLTITGPGSDKLTINRNSASTFRIFNVAAGARVTIQGLKITNGLASTGGGIQNQGSLTLSGVWLANNVAVGSTINGGGGISNIGGILTINASALTGNSATGASLGGGAIDNFNGTLSISNTTIYNNGTNTNNGGALRSQGTNSITIKASTIYNNSGSSLRGGISLSGGTLSIGNSIVAGNLPLTQNDIGVQSGTIVSLGFNYIGASTNLTNGANHDQVVMI